MKADFKIALKKIIELKKDARYLGAFVFGSVARGEETRESDIDLKVIMADDHCENINHPFINGKKLDVTFFSFKQLEALLEHQAKKGDRVPMLAESIILFDTTGKLKELKKKFQKVKPNKYTKKDYQLVQFLIFHADNKIKRAIEHKDYMSAQLGLHLNLMDILKTQYRIKGRWWVSDKRLLYDLKEWDKKLAKLLTRYLEQVTIEKKYTVWTEIIEHILKPLGGRQNIQENNCTCLACKEDLTYFS